MTIKRRTHCKYGHELTEENTYQVYHKNGSKNGRRCRLCTKTEKAKEYKARKAREYYEDDPEKFREASARWRYKNPEKLAEVYKQQKAARGPKKTYPLRTHCKRGHELIESNLYRYLSKQGHKIRQCKICMTEKNHRRAGKLRDNHLQRKYGITIEQFDSMLTEQGNCCFLCKTDIPGGMGTFAVDHCHSTFKIRKLLCYNCNTVLGKVNDDPELLRKMADYIESYQ